MEKDGEDILCIFMQLNKLDEIQALKEKSNDIGAEYKVDLSEFLSVNLTGNTSNLVANIILPAGKYVVEAYARYPGSDLRCYIALNEMETSFYDNYGHVAMHIWASGYTGVSNVEIVSYENGILQ